MRVNPNPMPDLMAALNQTQLEEQQAELQISTGKSVNEPSDNPTAAALLVENNDQATFNSGYLRSISAVQGQLSTASATLSSVTAALQQALSLGVEAGGGTLSASDRAAIANQLQGIQSQLVSLANTTYEGNYIFAGTITNTAPYVVDDTSPSGVNYAGNSDVNEVSIGNGYKLAVNQPGSQLFSAPGNDVFLAINNLIQAVQNNSGVGTAVNAVSALPAISRRRPCSMATPPTRRSPRPPTSMPHNCKLASSRIRLAARTWLRPPPISPKPRPITKPRWPPSASSRRRIISSVT